MRIARNITSCVVEPCDDIPIAVLKNEQMSSGNATGFYDFHRALGGKRRGQKIGLAREVHTLELPVCER